MGINFYKIEDVYLQSYYYYSAQISNNDLLELNSYKIRNILSLVFNKKTKDLILENLFNIEGTFLSSETKENLFRYLSLEERNDLILFLSTYLDYQKNSEWHNTIIQEFNNTSINTIIIPTLILNHELILTELKLLFPRKKFIDWLNYNETIEVLILDYNHAWKKRNLLRIKESNFKAYFLNHFFKHTYQWKIYKEEYNTFKCFNTQTRNLLIDKKVLTEVKENLKTFKPGNILNEWDVLHENEHSNSFNPQDEIVIWYASSNSNKYRINSSFLLEKEGEFIIKNSKELISNPEEFEKKFYFSNLENIISQIDLNELNKAIEKDKSINQIIQPLWSKFNLNENNGMLWKQLLKRKAIEYGIKIIFEEIEKISGVSQFISLNTFENAYCNPENNTIIPREKKVFKAICRYLNLPLEYRAAIHRERNLIGGHSQELNSNLKELIQAIVEYGVLDKNKVDDELLDILNQSIEKIENRVDMEYFGFTRESLLYACIAICYEIINKMRLKPILIIEYIKPN
jgi:hypothetical protein